MRYDDYQSLVKLYKKTIRPGRFSFLERKYKRLKKRGHPRKYIKIRKNKSYKPVLFDFNPFVEFSNKREKWKNYFLVWYELATYMRKQLMFWSSIKAWKLFHYKNGLRKVFGLKHKWFHLMYCFYEYRFLSAFYKLSFSHYSQHLSRSHHKKLRKFIKKYIRSLRWDAKKALRKQRRSRNKPVTFDVTLYKARGRRFLKKRKRFLIRFRRNQVYKNYVRIKKLNFSKRIINKTYGLIKRSLYSNTFKCFYNVDVQYLKRAGSIAGLLSRRYVMRSGKWFKITRRKRFRTNRKAYRVQPHFFNNKNTMFYSLGVGSTINVSKLTPNLKYSLLSMVDLSNNGKYREFGSINYFMGKFANTSVLSFDPKILLSQISKLLHDKLPTKKKSKHRRYNVIKNRKLALAKISRYMNRRPLIIPSLSRFVLSYKNKLIRDLLKYKQFKHTFNDYQLSNFKLTLMKKIRKWRSYKRKLKKLVRSFKRARNLAGTLKSWFIVRLTAKYRKVLIRLRKYMKYFSPKFRLNTTLSSFSPLFNNYSFFLILIYIFRSNYFVYFNIKTYMVQIMFLWAFFNKQYFYSNLVKFSKFKNVEDNLAITHSLVYGNA